MADSDNLPASPELQGAKTAIEITSDNPRSVVNISPKSIVDAVARAMAEIPEYFELDERRLYNKLRADACTPNPTDNRLRIKFWQEYESAQEAGRRIILGNVVAGVCTQAVLNHYLKNPRKVAWLLTPPASYVTVAEEALTFGLERMRDILEMDPMGPDGKLNTKLMELQAKIVTMLDNRLKGGVVQRVEQKTVGLNISTSSKEVAAMAMEMSMDEIEKRIKTLEAQERRALNLPHPGKVIDVESE